MLYIIYFKANFESDGTPSPCPSNLHLNFFTERLSSLRGRQGYTHNHTHRQAQQTGGRGGESAENPHYNDPRHAGRVESAPPTHQLTTTPKTTPSHENKPKVPPKLRKHKKNLSETVMKSSPILPPTPPLRAHKMTSDLSQSMDPIVAPKDSPSSHPYDSRGRRRSPYEKVCYNYNPAPGNFSSLPRTNSRSGDMHTDGSRGTKPYSSARYPSSTVVQQPQQPQQGQSTQEKRKLSLTRNASFHGTGEHLITVAPMDRNPALLSEETDDDSYLYRKSGLSRGGGGAANNYENVSRNGWIGYTGVNPNMTRHASVDDTAQSHSGSNIRRPSDEAGQVIAGLISPGPVTTPASFTGRTHEVIMEDPSATPNQEWNPNPENFQATFPRQVPSRSQSMNVHGDTRIKFPHQQFMLPQEFQQPQGNKTSCLRRGSSLHGPADVHGGEARAETLDLQRLRKDANHDADVVPELSSATLPRQHRRMHSYDNCQPTSPPVNMEVVKRRASEYYPATGEEGAADLPEDMTAGASATAQDVNQQVCVGYCTWCPITYYFP